MTSESSGPSEEIVNGDGDGDRSGSSGVENDRVEKLARSYRHHLSHNFDDRLREPLWQPVSCSIGDIGYMTPTGSFCVLFNVSCGLSGFLMQPADILNFRRGRVPLSTYRSRYRSPSWSIQTTKVESSRAVSPCGTPRCVRLIASRP
jgi:hypothetical protein